MIKRKSTPYQGSSVLLEGTSLHDIQTLLLRGYCVDELKPVLGEQTMSFPSSWTTIGKTGQLTSLVSQRGQGRLILPLAGQAYVLTLRPRALHPDPVIFRLQAGSGEAVWVPAGSAQGFYFLSHALILTAATKFRDGNVLEIDPTEKDYCINLESLTGTRNPTVSRLVTI